MRDFMAYAQFDMFWDRFQPETPFGRAEKEAQKVITEPATLEAIWNETDVLRVMLEDLEGDAVHFTRILHHLKRMPRFCEEARAVYDEVEIFQFKKFLHNYKCLVELLEPDVRRCFGLDYGSELLEERLDTGRQSAESFYISDAFSADLAEVRREIRATEDTLKELQRRRREEITTRWGFAFASKAFLLVPRRIIQDTGLASDLLLVEPYDDHLYVVRPRGTAEEMVLQDRRSALQARERACEDAVLECLSHALREERPRFAQYQAAITRFDLAFARARLAREHSLVRPTLQPCGLSIEGGRFIPCEESCRMLGTSYVPLDATMDAAATVLFGSNMGGKTIVLKTVAFLQLCVQMGLYVPAKGFATRVFQHFHYLGEGQVRGTSKGLSGFGFEIRQLVEASRDFEASTLILFDEFARTTNSVEAEAILSAVLESITSKPPVMALFSTHFRGVKRFSGVSYLRMRGLDRVGLDLELAAEEPLEARIRLIDQHMAYQLLADDGCTEVSDAIAVASLLGLDAQIAQRAADFFRNGH